MFVGTPLDISNDCLLSWVLRVEQSVPEYNVRSTVFLKHRTSWDSVRGVGRNCTWNTILKSYGPLDRSTELLLRSLVGTRHDPTTVLRSRSGVNEWLDASSRTAYDAKQTANRASHRTPNADHLCRFVLARAEA